MNLYIMKDFIYEIIVSRKNRTSKIDDKRLNTYKEEMINKMYLKNIQTN